MGQKIYGYIRVSSKDQNEARQVAAMEKFGVRDDSIFLDKQSGKDFDRPQYKKMMSRLKQGDMLVIKSIDRLGRNYDEILRQWKIITKEKRASIVVIDMPLLNTQRVHDLTGTLIADIVLQLLSYVAQTERELIKQRQAEGIAEAQKRGVRFGVQPKPKPAEYDIYFEKWVKGQISARAAAKGLGVHHNTFLRWTKENLLPECGERS